MKRLFLFLFSLVLLTGALICAFLFLGLPSITAHQQYGVTFSAPYASSLGLDPKATLDTAITELGVKHFRIPVYWSTVEREKDRWDFSEIDWQLDKIRAAGGTATLVVGRKQPRWPECWMPEWSKSFSFEGQEVHVLRTIRETIDRYKTDSVVQDWQVENEPMLPFGDCRMPGISTVFQEVALVRALDPTHPVVSTESGELAIWAGVGNIVDRLGVSVYRTVRNPMLGNANLHYWFVMPFTYRRKAELVKPFGVQDVYISEFQMEPWSNKDLLQTPIAEQELIFSPSQMRDNFSFAGRMAIHQIDFWGIEWWIWMRDHGHPEYLDIAKKMWKSDTSTYRRKTSASATRHSRAGGKPVQIKNENNGSFMFDFLSVLDPRLRGNDVNIPFSHREDTS